MGDNFIGSQGPRLNLDKPRWDQNTFTGRFRYFWGITNPLNCFIREKELNEAKELVNQYKIKAEPPGTTEEKLWHARTLYNTAFHPDTGELQNLIGRMSFQMPGGMMITGCMLTFYKSTPAVVFWQWVNQSFNALVNFTNRNAQSEINTKQLAFAYASATTSAVVTAIGLKSFLQKRATNLVQRFVPFAAVAAANCVNIPLMRQSELVNGIVVFDENGNKVGASKLAAMKGISQVLISRIVMAAPGMLLCPIIMERLEKYRWMQKIQVLHSPIQMGLVGCILIFMVPTACSLFPQQCSIRVSAIKKWEPESYSKFEKGFEKLIDSQVYFNKGL